ncbi:MAG: hypothetical protein CMK36_06650 [Porticoccaceae bacterium]|jgi:hypothetical protein|nr:hypothetical protein [Porticoccaceae bacterium]|tara:strand:+ start:1479 stop:1733 length:255 start_codon:yes stop_codon:yes gene_type:complete
MSDPEESLSHLRKEHHVSWEEGRGYFLRVTVIWSTKVVGKRIKVRLRTRDLDEAIARRDTIIAAYCALGFETGLKGELTLKPKK